jgi:hypothetical protein
MSMMSFEPDEPPEEVVEDGEVEQIEVEQGEVLPVVVQARELEPGPASRLGAAQAAAAAATGFVAGAATLALARRYGSRRVARLADEFAAAREPRDFHGLPVTGTRTYLVHVHTLGRPSE